MLFLCRPLAFVAFHVCPGLLLLCVLRLRERERERARTHMTPTHPLPLQRETGKERLEVSLCIPAYALIGVLVMTVPCTDVCR